MTKLISKSYYCESNQPIIIASTIKRALHCIVVFVVKKDGEMVCKFMCDGRFVVFWSSK